MKKIIAFSLFTILCSACATVIDGNKQQMAFDSNEKGVEIYINDKLACRTPCITEVNRANKKIMIVAKKQGYQEKTLFLDKNVNVTSVFNVLSLSSSTFGITTDLTTGDIWEYQPNSIYVAMMKEPQTVAERQKQQKQNQIRDFVLKNFDSLQNDSYSEQGSKEYIKTLSEMSGVSVSDIEDVLEKSYVATDCAERIIGLMLSK